MNTNINLATIPHVSGVYFLWRGTDVIYVGKSQDINKRVGAHCWGGLRFTKFDDVTWVQVPKWELDRIERLFILLFNPEFNDPSTRSRDPSPVIEKHTKAALRELGYIDW